MPRTFCKNIYNCKDCVDTAWLCEWDLRDSTCFTSSLWEERSIPRDMVARFESECLITDHSRIIVGSVIGLLIGVAILVGIVVCIMRNRPSRRMGNMQVTTASVLTVQQQPVLQPQPIMAIPVNIGYPQPQPQMEQGMMNQVQYQ